MKELFNNPKEEEYLSEFKQKIAQEMQEDIERRRRDLERSRNSFIGAVAGVVLAFAVSWFLLFPHFGFQSSKEIPVIRRSILPVKIRPSEPGGMEIQNQDKTVYALVEKNELEDTKVESLLPEPEQPRMPVIVADMADVVVSEPDLPPKTMDELINAVNTTATETIKIPSKLPVIDVKVQRTNDPLTVKKEEISETKEAPKEELKTEVEKIQAPKEVVEINEVQIAPKIEMKSNVEPAPKSDVVSVGSWCVQLMASNKKYALEKGYETLKKQYAMIRNLPYRIEESNDGMFRLKVGSYHLKSEADDLCFRIKSAGGNCMVKNK